jgi:peptide/nickel transport system substrate-binding protein
MNKKLAIAVILIFAMLSSMIVVAHASPPISRPMGFIEETIEGGTPNTVDYSIAYDTASGEIIMNMMDNLVIFNGEHTDQFLPSIATSWIITPLVTTIHTLPNGTKIYSPTIATTYTTSVIDNGTHIITTTTFTYTKTTTIEINNPDNTFTLITNTWTQTTTTTEIKDKSTGKVVSKSITTTTLTPPAVTTGPFPGQSNEVVKAGIDSGKPISGLSFENPDNQTGPNAIYYYEYAFAIRQGVFFQPPYNYSLTPQDVAFSFQRTLLMDTTGGPQWMTQEPLLDLGADSLEAMADLANLTQVAEVGALIQNAVQYNSTHVWFNLMFPSAYAPFMQILTQTWCAIESKQWINNQAIGDYGRLTWPGNWPDYTSWLVYRNPPSEAYPLDVPFPIMYGSGPYIINILSYSDSFWSGIRFEGYWRLWPADFPLLSGSSPESYPDTIYITWAFVWATRLADITSGATDFVAVPRSMLAAMFKGGVKTNYPLDGIRLIYPLPTLAVDAFFFTFDINPATLYGPIGSANVFFNAGIPSDFFGNTNWGINVRKGFAQAFNYATFLATAYLGEAMTPATALIPGLNYYDPTVIGWSYNLVAANASLNLVGPDSNGKMLKNVGFTLTLLYNIGNLGRLTACNLLAAAIQGLNPLYTVNVVGVAWATYLNAAVVQKLPMFSIGWLADFPDPHDFVLPFYRTGGSFAAWQAYSNPAMDALVDAGILQEDTTPAGKIARAAIYRNVQLLAVSDCPSFTLDQAIGRHFERDWVVGWYYNPVYPGNYYYNLNKWYFQAESQLAVAQNPPDVIAALAGFNLPVDVNYDGKVDMKDVGIVAHAFGTSFGPPQDTRWVFRGDINNDRKIDMKDIGLVAKQFSKTSAVWPTIYSNITAFVGPTLIANATNINISITAGTTVTFTEKLFGATTTYTLVTVDWQQSQWPGALLEVQNSLSLTYTFTFTVTGTYYIYNDIVVILHTINGDYTTSIVETAKITVT